MQSSGVELRLASKRRWENSGLSGITQPSRAAGHGVGRVGPAERAGRWRAWHQRDHRQGAPGPGDERDEGGLAAGRSDDGRETWRAFRGDGVPALSVDSRLSVLPPCSLNVDLRRVLQISSTLARIEAYRGTSRRIAAK